MSLDVEDFIASQRAKLQHERERLNKDSGILPRDSHSVLRDRLREERHKDYTEYVRARDETRRDPAIKSISEARRQLQQEREQELTTPTKNNFTSLHDRKLAEEKQYRNSMHHNPATQTSHVTQPSVRFEQPRSHWEDEEKGLLQWTREQHRGSKQRTVTPPMLDNHTYKSLRSLSAPVVAAEGIAGLGLRESTDRRDKQKTYAEELRAQIRERETSRIRDQPQRKSTPPYTSPKHSPTKHRSLPEQHSPTKQHNPHIDREDSYHLRGERDRYNPYPPPSHPNYPSGPYWAPPHYRYPPHMEYGPYYPPPFPPNPYYTPPLHYNDRHTERRMYRDEEDQSRTQFVKGGHSRAFMDNENVRGRFESKPHPQFHEKREENFSGDRDGSSSRDDTEFTSPLHGASGHTPRQDKNQYRAELEKQMREKKERAIKEKSDKLKYDRKQEVDVYDPWGKGGCGAPVKDQHGNLVADLKKMKKINDDLRQSLSPTGAQDIILSYDKTDGEEQKKNQQVSYQDYLRSQVKEKEQVKQKEKLSKMAEEQRELERIELERQKLEENFKRERQNEIVKDQETHSKNGLLKKEAEEKRRQLAIQQQAERVKESEREKLAIEERRKALVEKMEQPYVPHRSKSPPIPTLRSKASQQISSPPTSANPPSPMLQHGSTFQSHSQINSPPTPVNPPSLEFQHGSTFQSHSPPVPALRSKSLVQQTTSDDVRPHTPKPLTPPARRSDVEPAPSRTGSDVLSQLAAMRRHLQGELSGEMARPAHRAVGPRIRQPKSSIKLQQEPSKISFGKENSLLSSESTRVPLSMKDPFPPPRATRPHPPSAGGQSSRATRPHPPSAGGQSQFSVATYDVDSMAQRNEERMRRLDAILNAGSLRTDSSSLQDPQTILHNFLSKTDRPKMTSRQSEQSLKCDTQHIASNT